MVEFEPRAATEEEQEEQRPSPTQQQQDQQQLLLLLMPQSPEPAPPAWPPPAPAEFENVYFVRREGLRGDKGWRDSLVVKLNYESQTSYSVGASDAEPIDVGARSGVGTAWLFAMEDARRHERPAGEPFPPFGPD